MENRANRRKNDLEVILNRLDDIEETLNNIAKLTVFEGRTIMSALTDLQTVVGELADDVSFDADEIGVAIDLVKQLIADKGVNDPAITDAVTKLTAAHEGFVANAEKLKEAVSPVAVSGGVVTP
ncbi:MAG TPA: hypothetical protein VIJ93_09650 [bacterium]